jgi:2-polyprenyl-3-methyl-5-hydroxy-6-metoxy-1,4-benzoquinol methylase
VSNNQPYFSNHNRALKFPWSIYHKPLLDSLEHFLASFDPKKSKTILVIGPGDLQELSLLLHYGFRPSLLDIDERTLQNSKQLYPELIDKYYHVDENFNGYPEDQKFDAIYAKEVIEHILDTPGFLNSLKKVLKPNSKIWLSTPNYGFFLLPFLENTILEIVARMSGFSRKDIHPNKFNSSKLKKELISNGFKDVEVEITFAKLALCGTGTIP